MWVLLRIVIGSIFLVSGFGKLLGPYQNFLYVIEAYRFLPSAIEFLVAQIFPWIELFVGVFVILGLWTPWALRGALVCFGVFVVVVAQALLRGLPLDNCGCFGDWIHLKPQMVIVLDSASILIVFLLLRYCHHAQKFSLDHYFDRK
jgi:uncharacterized membrane protein YphA (DoxX/SURF4 family)